MGRSSSIRTLGLHAVRRHQPGCDADDQRRQIAREIRAAIDKTYSQYGPSNMPGVK